MFAFAAVSFLLLLLANIFSVIWAPSAGAWLAVGLGIVIQYLIFLMFFTDKSTMVIYSKNNDSITVFRYFALNRKEIKMHRMSNLFNVYPVEVKNQYQQCVGYNINLIFKNGETITFFTKDQ